MFRRGGPAAGRGGHSGRGNGSDEEQKKKRPADPARKAAAASDGARKRGARAWTNRGMRPPPAYERRELPKYDRRMEAAGSSSGAGSSSDAGSSSIALGRPSLPPPKREEEQQQELPLCSGHPLLPRDFVSDEDLPWVNLEVFQLSTEEEKRCQMEMELDERRLEVGIYNSLHEVVDISSDEELFSSNDELF